MRSTTRSIKNVPPPLAGPILLMTSETDRVNIMDLDNNLIGFQLGSRFDVWHPVERLTFEGFLNAGVYYNRVTRSNLMSVTTTQFTNDDTTTPATDEERVDVSTSSNLDISHPSEVATIGEASITGVYRLNRCWAPRRLSGTVAERHLHGPGRFPRNRRRDPRLALPRLPLRHRMPTVVRHRIEAAPLPRLPTPLFKRIVRVESKLLPTGSASFVFDGR